MPGLHVQTFHHSPGDPPSVPVRPILLRILLVPAMYLCYTGLILALPERTPAPPVNGLRAPEDVRAFRVGRTIWLERGCAVCHSIYGLGGHLGPDLTNAARPGMESLIRVTVRRGRGRMPAFDLSVPELNALVVYLRRIAATGTYPPRSWTDPVFGAGR